MLQDPKCRRLASEFACQWLHVADFDQHNEKSETKFPEFAELRSDMHEETLQFFTTSFKKIARAKACWKLIIASSMNDLQSTMG